MIRKEISIIISAIFILALMTSSPVSSVNVAGAPVRTGEDFLYSVSVSPASVRVQQGDLGTYDVQVLRGSDVGQFTVGLSLVSDSSVLKAAVSFYPPILNFEQGQTAGKSTMKINSQELELGTTAFRVQAATQLPAIPDQALSNPATLIVRAAEPRQSSNSLTDSESQASSSVELSPFATEQNRTPESLPTKLNNAPIAMAGQDQVIKEGERAVIDGSASTDPDKDALSFSWEQISPRQPTIKLETSDTLNKVSFVGPDIDRDTIFRFKLVVKDSNGGQAADSINILTKNVGDSASPDAPSPKPEEQQNQEPASQETPPGSGAGPASTENHSPTTEAQQVLSTDEGKPLSISLKGNDPDKDDKISFVILANPSYGTIAGFDKTSGSLTYLPTSGFTGQDRLTFKAIDSHEAESNVGIVVIRINAVSESPTSSPGATNSSTSSSSSPSSGLSPLPDNENATSASLTESTGAPAVTTGDNETSANTSRPNQQKTSASFATSSVVAGEVYQFIDKWGGNNGDFNNPHAVAIDSSGNAYVLDSGNNRIQKFDGDGNFILQWGSAGSTDGKFNNPLGIAVDRSSGSVYVVDTGNNRIQKFGTSGNFLIKWGAKGGGNSQFNNPAGVGIDSSGNVYVSDVNNHRIAKFDSNGIFVTKWGSTGGGQGQFKGPHGVAVDSNNFVLVSDSINNKVQKFTNIGQFVTSFGSSGSTDGKFNAPHGVAVDSDNSVFVTDRGNNRVQKFNNAGGFLTKFGTGGSGDGQFSGPDGIAVASSAKVYVTDIGNKRVQVFAIDTTGPDAPTLLSPVNAATINDNKPAFDWAPVTDLTSVTYTLLVDNDNAFGSPEISVSSLTTDAFTPTTALNDGIYYWKVSAMDGAGNVGPFSSVFSFTLDTIGPTVTASPTGGLYSADQSVTLTSSEPSGTTIYYTTDGTDPTNASTQYSAAIPITAEGDTTLKFFGVDTADNSGAIGTELYTIDKTAPTVVSTEPEADAVDVAVNSSINATFSEGMNADFANNGNFTLLEEDGVTPVDGTVSLSEDNLTATFIPTSSLTTSPTYTATIKGDPDGWSDKAGNRLVADHTWSFSTPATPAEISMTLDNTLPKWGHEVTADGTVTGVSAGDKVSIDWGDNSTVTEITPVPAGGQFTATHVYDVSAVSPNPQKVVVAKLLTSEGVERASSAELSVTLQKHATSLTVAVKPTEDGDVCASCPFTAFGKLVDLDTTPNTEVGGKTITFTGSGVPQTLNSVQTEGVTFTGTQGENLTLTSSVLQMPVGSEISLPSATHGVSYKFESGVGITLTKGNDQTIDVNAPGGTVQNADFPEGLKKITISSGSAELSTLVTRDLSTDGDEDHQIAIDFSTNEAAPGEYPTLVIEPGSYFSTGITQEQDGSGLTVIAEFNGDSDPAYVTSAAQLNYDVDSSLAGVGEGTPTAYNGLVWTKLTVGTATAGDACTVNGVASLDSDKDGICDRWEDALTSGNDATHRYIACPTAAGPVAIDPLCANTNGSIKYDLCFSDAFASVWGNKANGDRICPTKGHKDMYVEIDYMANHLPSTTAVRNVIKAFGNAPITGQTADAFGRTVGITLHVVVSDQFARVAPFNVWTDSTPSLNDFRGAKEVNFGTAAERGGTSGMPGMTGAAWTSTGKIMKHYVYHYGQWITYYGGACTASGLSSGLAELLGNDFIVSLGCGFGGSDPAGGSVGTDDEQAGTFMHELGHNLNLAHGGPASLAVGSSNYNMNCKPNYLSVMNYARQLPNAVLDAASWEAGFNYGGAGAQTSLDYAKSTLPDIPEGVAPEATNIVSSDAKQYWIVYGTPTKVPAVRKVLSGTTVDFDGSGTKVGSVSVDLNALSPTVAGCGPIGNPSAFPLSPDLPQTLKSYSDWDKINLVFVPDGDSQDGITQRVSQPFINKNTQELKPVFLQSIQDVADQISFIPPPNPDGSTTFNTGSNVPLKFRLTDKDGISIANAVVRLVAEKGPTTIVGSTPFVYDSATGQYKYGWNTPSGASARGEWTLKYIMNYQSTNPALPESVLLGPFATGPYTLKITGVK